MIKERITLWQFALLLFVSRSVLVVAEMPSLTAGRAGRAGVWAVILFTLIGPPVVLYYVGLARRFPDKNVFQYSTDLLGPWVGRLVTLPLLWALLHYAAVILRSYGEVVVTAALPRTPLVFVMGCMIFVCAVGVRVGIESLGRSAEILVPLFLISVVTVMALILPGAELQRLTPMTGTGFAPIIGGAIVPSAFYFLLTSILVLYPLVAQKRKAAPAAVYASLGAGLLAIAAHVVALAVFGPYEVGRMRFPFLSLARLIEVGEFIERVESVVLAAWGAGLFLELALVFWAGAVGLARWLGVRDYRRLVFPMGSILLTLSLLLFPDNHMIDEFLRPEVTGVYGAFMILFVPGVLWIASLLRSGKSPTGGDRKVEPGR